MRSELVRIVARGFGVALVLAVSCVTIPAALFSVFAQEEVARVPSPTGLLEAVLIETNGGATTSFRYRVIITRPGWHWRTGTEVVSLYGAIRSESAYGANLVWQNDDALSVEYLSARREEVVRPTASIAGHEVATTLRPGIDDLPDEGHRAWGRAYKDPDFWKWLQAQQAAV